MLHHDFIYISPPILFIKNISDCQTNNYYNLILVQPKDSGYLKYYFRQLLVTEQKNGTKLVLYKQLNYFKKIKPGTLAKGKPKTLHRSFNVKLLLKMETE